MHFRSEDDPQAQELAALIADKGPQAALAQISGLDANSEVVSEAVTALIKQCNNGGPGVGYTCARITDCQICGQPMEQTQAFENRVLERRMLAKPLRSFLITAVEL